MIFKIYNCTFGFKYNGTNYEFSDVRELQVEDPERNRLTRGANSTNKIGIVYKEGMMEPKRWTIPVLNLTAAMMTLLQTIFENQGRVDLYAIDNTDGSSKMAKEAILSNYPQQLTLTDSPDSMDVSLEFETFESTETHKA